MQQTVQLAPGQSAPEIVPGKYLTIVSCTAAFAVELDNAGKNVAVAGSQFSKGDGFSRLTFFETSGKSNTIVYDASDTPSPGRVTAVQANAATFVGANSGSYDMGSLANPLGVTFPGVDALGRARKVIYISNSGRATVGGVTSTANVAAYVGNLAAVALLVGTNVTVPIETSDTLTLFAILNDLSGAAAHLQVSILEVFYSKPLQADT